MARRPIYVRCTRGFTQEAFLRRILEVIRAIAFHRTGGGAAARVYRESPPVRCRMSFRARYDKRSKPAQSHSARLFRTDTASGQEPAAAAEARRKSPMRGRKCQTSINAPIVVPSALVYAPGRRAASRAGTHLAPHQGRTISRRPRRRCSDDRERCPAACQPAHTRPREPPAERGGTNRTPLRAICLRR